MLKSYFANTVMPYTFNIYPSQYERKNAVPWKTLSIYTLIIAVGYYFMSSLHNNFVETQIRYTNRDIGGKSLETIE